ncbi:hypothetical protein RRG08_051286 [Elysia crispata]|uniref:Uncharacterized protein n=1 Tax=Elysia crispata TaxID=231223 RepID=A0AAE0YB70_9GAST|nr:hypothetical protein RRG08_051286 [Elysia crispata]
MNKFCNVAFITSAVMETIKAPSNLRIGLAAQSCYPTHHLDEADILSDRIALLHQRKTTCAVAHQPSSNTTLAMISGLLSRRQKPLQWNMTMLAHHLNQQQKTVSVLTLNNYTDVTI